jgi:hypothetical protein
VNYTQLQARATLFCQLEGWTDISVAPDFSDLINRAWYQFSWDAECVIVEEDVTTAVSTLAYTLTNKVKRILDVVYDTASTKSPVLHSTEDYERNLRADWRYQASGVPVRFTFNQFNTIALIPPPSAIKVVRVREMVQGTAFTTGTDVPPIPDYFHEAIALYAAVLQGKVYAQGEAAQRLASYEAQYRAYVEECKSYGTLQPGGN